MNVIEYREEPAGRTQVFLEGRRVGVIEPAPGGFRYRAGEAKGDVYGSVSEVKRSLEDDGAAAALPGS